MGAKSRNFHTELMARMGFEDEAHKIQDLFFEGKRDEAIMAVPDAFADEISLVGPKERIAERLDAWRATPVTTLLVGNRDPETLRLLADLTADSGSLDAQRFGGADAGGGAAGADGDGVDDQERGGDDEEDRHDLDRRDVDDRVVVGEPAPDRASGDDAERHADDHPDDREQRGLPRDRDA